MNLQLQSISLISGPDRPRGAEQMFIGVEAIFRIEDRVIKGAGFGILKEESEGGLKAAIQSAVTQAEEIVRASFDPFDVPSTAVPVETVKQVAKMANTAAVANAKLKSNDSLASDLTKPCDDTQQKQIDTVCGELGITVIDVSAWQKGEALCLMKALEAQLTEAKANPDGT